MNRCFQLAAIFLALAAPPALARTWALRNGQHVEGDFVRVGDNGHIIIAAGDKMTPVRIHDLLAADYNYFHAQVDLQAKIAAEVEERKWTDINEGIVVGHLLSVEKGKVILVIKRNTTGYETVRKPFDKFIKADRDYIRKEMTARGEGDKVPKEHPPQKAHQPKKNTKPKNPAPPNTTLSGANPPNPAQQSGAAVAAAQTPPKATGTQPQALLAAMQPPGVKESAPKDKAAPKDTSAATTAIAAAVATYETKSSAERHSGCSKSERALASSPAPPCKYRICSHCGSKLPDTCKLGDDCPNCGAHFTYEDTEQGRDSAPATLRNVSAPIGIFSLLGVVALSVFRIRWYMMQG